MFSVSYKPLECRCLAEVRRPRKGAAAGELVFVFHRTILVRRGRGAREFARGLQLGVSWHTEIRAWRSAVLLICLEEMLVSDTWKVMPMVKAM